MKRMTLILRSTYTLWTDRLCVFHMCTCVFVRCVLFICCSVHIWIVPHICACCLRELHCASCISFVLLWILARFCTSHTCKYANCIYVTVTLRPCKLHCAHVQFINARDRISSVCQIGSTTISSPNALQNPPKTFTAKILWYNSVVMTTKVDKHHLPP